MQSTVDLFNTALARLGGDQLIQLTSAQEQTKIGRICANLFPHVLEMTLSSAAWAFAIRRKLLSTPTIGSDTMTNPTYRFVFELPTDCVKPVRLEGSAGINRTPAYVIEGLTIRSNVERAVFVYVSRITDPTMWPPLFADALAWAMAGELASAINNDTQKQQWCYENHRIALAGGMAQDNTDQNPIPQKSEWGAARFGGDDD